MEVIDEALQHKEKGNESFKLGDWEKAISQYSQAIKIGGENHKDLSVFYKNRAACFLKTSEFARAERDCLTALKLTPNDPKALFRKAQALEGLEKFEEAYKSARDAWNTDPNNKALQQMLERLHGIVQERVTQHNLTSNKVSQMVQLAFDFAQPSDKRVTAMNNIHVLARESVAADILFKDGIFNRIQRLLKVEKNNEIYLSAIRTVGEICNKSVERTQGVLKDVGIPWFLEIIDSSLEDRVNAAQHCMQTILNTFSGMENKVDSKPVKALCDEHQKEIDTLLSCLLYSVTNPTISGLARDAIIQLITRNIHHTALSWAERLVELNGLWRLMEICSELEEYKYESAMNITSSSRTIASVCLARVYENMYYDAARERFHAQIDEYVKDKLLSPDLESKVRVTVAITSLLLGPLDVGNTVVSREGILQMILAMASMEEDPLQQKVACECLIAAASKKDKAKAIISQGIDILKKLYTSKNEGIRVRALVGLCKLGSSGGLDASIRPFADGSTSKLAEACRRFLVKPGKDRDIRKWAAEGLSYLTLDAEVKEKLIEDRPAIQALIELTKEGDQSVLYGVVTTFVNLCNAYETQEIVPEMLELAKFAKHHIPEEHELDDPDFISKRVVILGNEGITTALVALAKTDSDNSKELIARVFNALCGQQEIRGKVVQHGGAKALLPMALQGTDKGKRQAAQALSRIGISINPEVAFPGQRSLEIVRPLLNQLHQDFTALENFEAMLALCNLASQSESVRQRILNEQGLSRIEMYLMEDHLMLRRAAAQCICNLTMSSDVVKAHEGSNDKIKFLALLSEDEDEETAVAASGALAILTSTSDMCCKKIFDVQAWLEVVHTWIANPSPQVQHRGVVTILNMINSGKETAQKLFDTDVMELLMGLSQLPDDSRAKARETAMQCLKAAEKYQLIEKSDEPAPIPDVFKEEEERLRQEQLEEQYT
ncbi:protein unc-45 homolog B [Phlebotomus argentipes]|uniref:protein unc-45 homolog B n=1 Tax=Phlebotomus argentipes TaxID=94469 RepID=UPI0028933695|nr:protein unc-45 homolog B [Phlebotomus argentipes]